MDLTVLIVVDPALEDGEQPAKESLLRCEDSRRTWARPEIAAGDEKPAERKR